ncbi:TetR/AcrR family transcriptional regulator [Paeniroseomonas aquatica]|uniref:TetR/AcrR family transcriptional regulator n=1 Tax=Paeniroseomonas aquatica TaxID=373043 RepID=UPI00361305E2
MVRTARYSEEDFIEATMALVGEGGPAAATMQAIARRVGAPTGSIYHRFESRAAVLGAAWNAAYGSFTRALAPLLHEGRPRDAALAILPWSRENGHRARFLLLHEPVTLFEDTPPPAPQRLELERLEEAFDGAFRACLAVRRGTPKGRMPFARRNWPAPIPDLRRADRDPSSPPDAGRHAAAFRRADDRRAACRNARRRHAGQGPAARGFA